MTRSVGPHHEVADPLRQLVHVAFGHGHAAAQPLDALAQASPGAFELGTNGAGVRALRSAIWSPSTDDCAPDVGRFVVDGNPAPARTGYLRFDVPSPPEASSIVELRLELTPPQGCLICEGKATGDVYAVEPFTADSLNMAPPAVQAVLAAGTGPVVNGEAIEIALPTDVLGPDGTLFVSLVPTSADEVHFWSTSGLAPPRLRIVAMP